MHRQDEARRGARPRYLLDGDEHHQRPRVDPAVVLRKGKPEEIVLAEKLDHVLRELGRLVDFSRARGNALTRERPDQVTDLALLVGQRVERHRRRFYARRCG